MQKLTSFPKVKGAEAKLRRVPSAYHEAKWFVVDANNVVLGKLATEVANRLRGKNKPQFSDNVDTGDHVIVINAEKIALSGNKLEDKQYRRHSGYLGHMQEENAAKVMEKQPARIIKEAVYGMLPKNKLRKIFMAKLYIYKGPDHKHGGQNPESFKI